MTKKTKEAPIGVKILAILSYIGAVLFLISGVAMLFGGSFLANIFGIASLGFGLVLAAIVMFAFAVLDYFVGKGLWKGQNWARILIIVFAILGFVSALFSLFKGNFGSIFALVIDGLIAWYLLLHKEVKKFFK